jgi:t-SNARE complex subunit (syntaxin)
MKQSVMEKPRIKKAQCVDIHVIIIIIVLIDRRWKIN